MYSLSDLRYSVVAVADTTGAMVERLLYDAHGVSSVADSVFVPRTNSNYDWEFRYTGRRIDLETDIYFFRVRYYHNELGRFLSKDPLATLMVRRFFEQFSFQVALTRVRKGM